MSPPSPFSKAFFAKLNHGDVVGIHLPRSPVEVPEQILAELHPAEREIAQAAAGYRQVQFVGGRLALIHLFAQREFPREPVVIDEHGAPVLPENWAGSISHTRDLAVAILTRGDHGLGIDVEGTSRPRPGVEEKVLCADELDDQKSLPEDEWWVDTVIRFSIKEALYKAAHRFVRRYIGFREFAVWPDPSGNIEVEPRFAESEHLAFEALFVSLPDHIIATAAVRQR